MCEKIKELRGLVRGGRAPRELLLAYAYARGVAYARVELTTRTPIWVRRIAEMAGQPEEAVLTWLQVSPSPELLAHAAEARRAHFEKKEQRRQFILAARAILREMRP